MLGNRALICINASVSGVLALLSVLGCQLRGACGLAHAELPGTRLGRLPTFVLRAS